MLSICAGSSPYWPAQLGGVGSPPGPVYPAFHYPPAGSPIWPPPQAANPHYPAGTSTPPTSWFHPAHHNQHQSTTPGHTWGALTPSPNTTLPVTPAASGGTTTGWANGHGAYPNNLYAQQPLSAPATFEPMYSPWGYPAAGGASGGAEPHSAGPFPGHQQPLWNTTPKRRQSSRKKRRSSSRRRVDDDVVGDDDVGDEEGWVDIFRMKRSSSSTHAAHGSRPSTMQRSVSFGAGGTAPYIPHSPYAGAITKAGYPGPPNTSQAQLPGYMQADTFHEGNLARRPRDWRSDYTPRTGIASSMLALVKNKSDVTGMYLDRLHLGVSD